MSKKYIHYGSKEFDPNLFEPIKNQEFVKPLGGLWASPVDALEGWKVWCEANDFRECNEENSFTFTLAENAKVLHLYKSSELDDLPKLEFLTGFTLLDSVLLDFEGIKSMGYDAIELHLSEEILAEDHRFYDGLYWKLYGWDCDSILIMNPEIIKEED
jgi:hypothetical protein